MERSSASIANISDMQAAVETFAFESLRCPVTGNKAVAVCTNPHVERKLVCTACLVRDVDFVRKHRPDLVPVEDIKPSILDAMSGYKDANTDLIMMGLGGAKSAIMKDLLNMVAQGFEDAFAKKKEEFAKLMTAEDDEYTIKGQPKSEDGVDWLNADPEDFKKAISGPDPIIALCDLLNTLKANKIVKAKLAVSEILLNSSKAIDARKETIKNDSAKLAEAFVNSVISKIDLSAGFDNSCILKRWNNLAQSYNYMNDLNSLLIMVSEPSILFGFSQYFTTSASFDVKFRLTEGEFATGNIVVEDSDYTIRSETSGQPDRRVEGISNKTFPVFLPRPIQLKPKIWYNISFHKPHQSHYIYYGTGPTQGNGESFTFSSGTKKITFRRAPDDTIDNSPTMGQFPEIYLK